MRELDANGRRALALIAQHMRNVGMERPDIELFAQRTCKTCGGPSKEYAHCYPCKKAREQLGDDFPDSIALLTYAGVRAQARRDFYAYKEQSAEASLARLDATLRFFIKFHSGCFRAQTGEPVTGITWVPSSKGRTDHPLSRLMTAFPSYLERIPLAYVGAPRTQRATAVSPDRFTAGSSANGRHVILVEDCWVRGVNVLSAAAAIKRSGASRVSVLALGRYFDAGKYEDQRLWLESTYFDTPYDPTFCPVAWSFQCPAGETQSA